MQSKTAAVENKNGRVSTDANSVEPDRSLSLLIQHTMLKIAPCVYRLMLSPRLFSGLSRSFEERLKTCAILRCFATFQTNLERWERRCDKLTQLQQRIRFRPLQTITVKGRDVTLPLRSVEAMRTPSQSELEYLVGFFDGDGCVSMEKQTGRLCLSISQNIDAVEVLLHFRLLLGGGICRHSASTGSKKAVLQWHVRSPR